MRAMRATSGGETRTSSGLSGPVRGGGSATASTSSILRGPSPEGIPRSGEKSQRTVLPRYTSAHRTNELIETSDGGFAVDGDLRGAGARAVNSCASARVPKDPQNVL